MLNVGDVAPSFTAQPVFGLTLDVAALTVRRPLVLCFVRQLTSPFTREALALLQARHRDFDIHGAQVVAITDSEPRVAQDFVPRYHVLYPLVCDEGRALFDLYQVGGDAGLAGAAAAVARAGVRPAFRALRHGLGGFERKGVKLPADFVIAPGGRIAYADYGRKVTHLPDLDAMVAAVERSAA